MMKISPDLLVLFLHVLGGCVLVGGSLAAVLVRRGLMAARTPEALLSWLEFDRLSARANPVAALLVLATGAYLAAPGAWREAWFHLAVAAWLLNGVLAVAVVQRTAARLGEEASRCATGALAADVEARRQSPAWRLAVEAMLASDVAVLYLMIAKPSLATAAAVLGLAALVVLGGQVARRPSRLGAAVLES